MLRAHVDSSQQPPLLFAEDAVNLPHRWEVKLIWKPIKMQPIVTQAAANQPNTKGRFKADLFWLQSWAVLCLLYTDPQTRSFRYAAAILNQILTASLMQPKLLSCLTRSAAAGFVTRPVTWGFSPAVSSRAWIMSGSKAVLTSIST